MIELSVIDLFYFVLTFFAIILGTLLTLVLLRLLKILAVLVEFTKMYWNIKKMLQYYAYVPFVLKEKIFESLAHFGKKSSDNSEATSEK